MNSAGDSTLFDTRAEIFRIARLCAPGMESLGALTFSGNPACKTQRRQWINALLIPCLAPAVSSAYNAAKQGFRELAAADHKLNDQLAGPLAKNSRAAGRQIARSFKAPVGETSLERYLPAVDREECPGHMAIVFTARASIFHLPAPLVLAAIIFLEFRSSAVGDLWPAIEDCLQALPASNFSLRAA